MGTHLVLALSASKCSVATDIFTAACLRMPSLLSGLFVCWLLLLQFLGSGTERFDLMMRFFYLRGNAGFAGTHFSCIQWEGWTCGKRYEPTWVSSQVAPHKVMLTNILELANLAEWTPPTVRVPFPLSFGSILFSGRCKARARGVVFVAGEMAPKVLRRIGFSVHN